MKRREVQTKVYAVLPRTGMANRIFVWAEALVYAQKLQLPFFVIGWYKTQLGPWIRREKSKRFYAFYFISHTDHIGYYYRTLFHKDGVRFNPLEEIIDVKHFHTFIFNRIPDSKNYFGKLEGHHQMISDSLWKMIRPEIKQQIISKKAPGIGVHVRRGDFAYGSVLEQEAFFIRIIRWIRDLNGQALDAKIFTDGSASELPELSAEPNLSFYKGKTDIEDLMVLSRSKYIVTSIGSTFSYWAAYLSEATIFYSPRYEGKPIRWNAIENYGEFLIEQPGTISD